MEIVRRGVMLVLSSPSGAGKTSIARALVEKDPHVVSSVSVTTRPRRPAEVDGLHYHFVSDEEFQRRVEANEFLEHVEVFGFRYGTLRATVEQALASGRDIIFDIDWQGMQQMAQLARSDLASVFILPPSYQELEHRLRSRSQDSQESIARRLSEASHEMSHWPEYDYVLINLELSFSIAQVQAILQSERLRRIRQIGLADFVKELRSNQTSAQ